MFSLVVKYTIIIMFHNELVYCLIGIIRQHQMYLMPPWYLMIRGLLFSIWRSIVVLGGALYPGGLVACFVMVLYNYDVTIVSAGHPN